MSEAANAQGEIEDVLASIRRLVSDTPSTSARARAEAAEDPVAEPVDEGVGRLILSPSFRVHDADGDVPLADAPDEQAATEPTADATSEQAQGQAPQDVGPAPAPQADLTPADTPTDTQTDDEALADMLIASVLAGDIGEQARGAAEAQHYGSNEQLADSGLGLGPGTAPAGFSGDDRLVEFDAVGSVLQDSEDRDDYAALSADVDDRDASEDAQDMALAEALAKAAAEPDAAGDAAPESGDRDHAPHHDQGAEDIAAHIHESDIDEPVSDDTLTQVADPLAYADAADARAQADDGAAEDGHPAALDADNDLVDAGFESETGDESWPDQGAEATARLLAAQREVEIEIEGGAEAALANIDWDAPFDEALSADHGPSLQASSEAGRLTIRDSETQDTEAESEATSENPEAETKPNPKLEGIDRADNAPVRRIFSRAPQENRAAPEASAVSEPAPDAAAEAARGAENDQNPDTDLSSDHTADDGEATPFSGAGEDTATPSSAMGNDAPQSDYPAKAEAEAEAEDLGSDPSPFTFPDALDNDDDDTVIDEEVLREMIVQVVRDELQGVLGQRITRNVRKMVRREIRMALAADELD